ncbi:MAG: Trk system potassium transporter TrkA [Planctomycetota bacterium]|nr:Trk system potassium transporter TrkA [Planctomycetota bacterium]
MRILVVGAGVVGSNLASQLSLEGHDIAVIEEKQEIVRRLSDRLDIYAVQGNGGSPSVLEQAGIKESQMVIAVTESDTLNMTVCLLAHQRGVETKIARVRNPEYSSLQKDFHIDRMINPEGLVVESILKLIEVPGTTEVADFADGRLLLRAFDVAADSKLTGKYLHQVKPLMEGSPFVVVGISRGEEFLIPSGKDRFYAGDRILVLLPKTSLSRFLVLLNLEERPAEKAVLYGAGRLGIKVAARLEGILDKLVVIEPDEEKAAAASSQLFQALVLRGQATDLDLLWEADIQTADYFLALGSDEESNVMSSLLAKKHGAKRAIVLTQQPDYVPILDSIGLDIIINPRLVTVSAILQHLRRGRILSVVKFHEREGEAIELVAEPHSGSVGKPLKNLKIPKGAIVGAVFRDGEAVIPDGETIIEPNQRLIVFALPEAIPKVEILFSRKKLFAI